jgi:hypothetical protein
MKLLGLHLRATASAKYKGELQSSFHREIPASFSSRGETFCI